MSESAMKVKGDIAVMVGRFQIDRLHQGQDKILETLNQQYAKLVVVLGISPVLGSKSNPLDYSVREAMVKHRFPKAIVLPLLDERYDEVWSQKLDRLLRETFPMGKIVLYGGRSSFIDHYKGQFATVDVELPPDIEVTSGTSERERIGKEVRNSADFRAGIIHATQNVFPRIFPVVDIACIDTETKMVLLGRKKHERTLRFPGGFVDVRDRSIEDAAKREFMEETGLTCDIWKYIGSTKIQDWRFLDDTILSSIFVCEYQYGAATASDDLVSLGWYPWSKRDGEQEYLNGELQVEHRPIMSKLFAHLLEKKYV